MPNRILDNFFRQNKSVYIEQHHTRSPFSGSDSWVILSDIEQRIKAKIEAVGTPLKDWDINIYRGILTGLNEAFIITGAKRAELIAEDTRSAEIIRPILRGRDIKRYGYDFADLWIVATFPSLKIDIEQYPAVKRHLLGFGFDRIKQTGEPGARKKTNNKWFETQDSISYWEDFDKQKIVYPDIMRMPKNLNEANEYPYIHLDNEGYFVEATNFIITGSKIEAIYMFLTSGLGLYVFTRFYCGPQFDSSGFRYKKAYLENIPIPLLDVEQINSIERLVQQIDKPQSKIENELFWSDYVGLSEEESLFISGYKASILEEKN